MLGLRYILEIEHSHYSRMSSEEAYDEINILLNSGEHLNDTKQDLSAANHYDKPKNKETQ